MPDTTEFIYMNSGRRLAVIKGSDGLYRLDMSMSDPSISSMAAASALAIANQAATGNPPSSDVSTLLASQVRNASNATADQTPPLDVRGALFFLDVSAAGGALKTLRLDLEAKDSISNNYVPIASTGVIGTTVTGVGTYLLLCYAGASNPLLSVLTNLFFGGLALPRVYRCRIIHSDGSNWTYSLSQNWLR